MPSSGARATAVVLAIVAAMALPAGAQSDQDAGLRPLGAEAWFRTAEPAASGADASFRYEFYATRPLDLYLMSVDASFHAASRPGWTTTVRFLGPGGEVDLGPLAVSQPLEVGHVDARVSYGLQFDVHVPAADASGAMTWRMTYTLAVHTQSADSVDNGASRDLSVGVPFELTLASGAASEPLGSPWTLPDVPPENPFVPDVADGGGSGGVAGLSWTTLGAIAFGFALLVFVIVALRSRRARTTAPLSTPASSGAADLGTSSSAAPGPPAAPVPVASPAPPVDPAPTPALPEPPSSPTGLAAATEPATAPPIAHDADSAPAAPPVDPAPATSDASTPTSTDPKKPAQDKPAGLWEV